MSEKTRNLLIEIGTEELPPKALSTLSEAFHDVVCSGLEQRDISYTIAHPYAAPRRLAVLVQGVIEQQMDRAVERRGPPLDRAIGTDGQPSKAAAGFARSCGVEFDALEELQTDKGSWLVYRTVEKGQSTMALVPKIVEEALAALPIPRRMHWGDSPYEFVRPVHWIVLLFDDEIIECEIMGIKSGRETRGHRFHHPQPIKLYHAHEYSKILENEGYVIPVFATRRERVRLQIMESAESCGGMAVIDDDLLNEVTSIVDWPKPIVGGFDERFLDVPAEALIASMKGHQKCFHMVDNNGKLMPYFIAISNIDSREPEKVRTGNERVIRPRLSDAMFFWEQDRNQPLEKQQLRLKKVVFQKELGSLYDKSLRNAELCSLIAELLGADPLQGIRAAQLCKCDLLSLMVGEFPELQGIMGEYYARHDKETEVVAIALREQYMPRFAGDMLPETIIGQILAIADRLDTLVGIFGIGQPPTGDKDPFGLRRAALGVLRILVECELPLDLRVLLEKAQQSYPDGRLKADSTDQVLAFMLERLRGYYQDKAVNADSVDAVLACQPTSPLAVDRRIRGVEAFRQTEAASHLASANKRIQNLLKKAEEDFPSQPNPTYFMDASERALYDRLEAVSERIESLLKQADYAAVLNELATLQIPVDTFFDKVMVMDKDPQVRQNRLAFLNTIHNLFLQVADISRLQHE